jgi:hypothetical protein
MSACKEVDGVTEYGVYICDTASNSNTRTPKNAANARLIAAAPDLLEAALLAREFIRRIAGTMPIAANGESLTLTKLSNAIAKAEGVEQ